LLDNGLVKCARVMLVLQQLFNLSDEEFVGLGVMNDFSDATTVAFFREHLQNANVIEGLFEIFESHLRDQGKSSTRWME